MNFLVTGGSRGLGRQLVLDLVSAGHDVAFTYLQGADAAAQVEAEAGALAAMRRCISFRLDQRDGSAVEETCARIIETLGEVDVFVGNAAINRRALLASMADEEWHEVLNTNLTGPFLFCRALIPHFLAARRGRFIHISSVAMHGEAGLAGYAASKAGLIGLSGSVAREYGRRGITSNVLVLGLLEGGIAVSDTTQERWRNLCPAGRVGRFAEVSGSVLFLASDAATFVNGQAIGVTGGLDWAP
jgi:NAD(P)-dependent dehydrogenase (short-subunit alcohol dehydrogenase family)